MTTKKQRLYEEIIYFVVNLAEEMFDEKIQPSLIMSDFEVAILSAMASKFPTARVKGCWFHYVAEWPSCSQPTSLLTSGLPGTSSPPSSTFPQLSGTVAAGGPTTSPPSLNLPGTNLTHPPPSFLHFLPL